MKITTEMATNKYANGKLEVHPKELMGVAAFYSKELGKLADNIFTGKASKGAFKWNYPQGFEERHRFLAAALTLKSRILGKFDDVDPEVLDKVFRTYAP